MHCLLHDDQGEGLMGGETGNKGDEGGRDAQTRKRRRRRRKIGKLSSDGMGSKLL